MANEPKSTTVTIELFVSWLWVGIPLAWGVWVTLNNAIKLFQPPAV